VAHCDSIAETVLTMAEILVPLAAVVVAGRPVHAGSVAFLVGDPIQVMTIRLRNIILVVTAIVASRFDDRAQLRTRLHVLQFTATSPSHEQGYLLLSETPKRLAITV
jgi:hypothetical protein